MEEKRLQARRDLVRLIDAFGPSATVRMTPNNMAAGPCDACLREEQRTVLASEAPLPPLDECPHPDQCAARYHLVSYETALRSDAAGAWRGLLNAVGRLVGL